MATSITAIRAAMASVLSPIEANVSDYASANPTPPAIQIVPPAVEYDRAMHRGVDEWTFIIQAMVAFTEEASSQQLLDEVCLPSGSTSIKALLEADTTLGGTCLNLRVLRQSEGKQFVTPGGSPMLVVEFTVQVFAGGS